MKNVWIEEILSIATNALQRSNSNNQARDDRLKFKADFLSFINEMSLTNLTWKFWSHFVLKDCLAYVGLYIKNQKWKLGFEECQC